MLVMVIFQRLLRHVGLQEIIRVGQGRKFESHGYLLAFLVVLITYTPARIWQPYGLHMSYCEDTVRRYDRDRYRLALSQRPDRRPALFALFAFNHEIAKTREVVSDPTLGLIRLQWWRDAIDG